MAVSDTSSPRMVIQKMVENLAKTKAAEAPVEEKKKRGRKPKTQSAAVESKDGVSNRKPGRPKKQSSDESTPKTRKGKPGPKPKSSVAQTRTVVRKKPGPKPKTAIGAPVTKGKRKSSKLAATNGTAPLSETKVSKTSDAIVTLTISGSAAAIKRALAELQG